MNKMHKTCLNLLYPIMAFILSTILLCISDSFAAPQNKINAKASERTAIKGNQITKKETPKQITPGVFDFSLHLSKSLEPRREELRKDIVDAQKDPRAFALKKWLG